MAKIKLFSSLAVALSLQFSAVAADVSVSKSEYERVVQHFANIRMNVEKVENSPVDGLYQVTTKRGLFYFSKKGSFLVHGQVYNMEQGMKNETEAVLAVARKDAVAEFASSMIEFKAKDEKYVVNVFTDTTCGYCRKLHGEMKDYNAAGITVRYLAFPRGGMNSRSFDDLVSIWCADDKQQAMTDAKMSGAITAKKCDVPIQEHYELGSKLGVSGTPAIILESGQLIPGYQPADQLLKILQSS
ncbi:bifunctional protein-disulfide isomerase/oxidoreductase DsbC [Saccharobesus litoralis]|uniref:Thiol:disulfide interchange protein n=1 Tax=Saccharobesus litoralis TaxID=2172099 RepID=A0A2S0VUT7_9ALTE|nr:bifunctional protein-disulfide isomerase/oxidoreductase DsbC [Saccharobesus litoralis]AWB67984.1 bifunctional protein-disulfide isomerase/oxidoreductase DsbC [Saccharobesus litoralis]